MSTAIAPRASAMTVSQAARWLAENGFTPSSRHSIEAAIAHRKLRASRPADRVLLVRVDELREYARAHCREASSLGAGAA